MYLLPSLRLLLPIYSYCWNVVTPVLRKLAFHSFILLVQPSMNRITAFGFLIGMVHPLHPFRSLSSNTVSAASSMPRKLWVVSVNQRHHVKRRRLRHNEPPVPHDDIADVSLQLRINSSRHTSSGDVSLSIEHEHSPQPYSLCD